MQAPEHVIENLRMEAKAAANAGQEAKAGETKATRERATWRGTALRLNGSPRRPPSRWSSQLQP